MGVEDEDLTDKDVVPQRLGDGDVVGGNGDGDGNGDGNIVRESADADRQAQPVDAEAPPRLPFPVVGIGASAGGLEAVSEFLAAMPPDGGMAFVLVQHLPPDRHSLMVEILAKRTAMPVLEVEDGQAIRADHLYVIRPGHVLTIRDGRLRLGPRLDGPRAANRPVDDFFKSLAEEQRERAIAILMSGMGSNGTAGAQAVKAVGGLCIAQKPESAQFPSMPRHLIDSGNADYILKPAEIPDVLLAYAGHPYVRDAHALSAAAAALRSNEAQLRDVLAILRSRTRQEFGGYKKPTILRRVQRRMGLARVTEIGDYVRLLRHSPAEVTALADDLLIHVTGFFRDPAAWDALRERVIAPLVAAREPESQVRCWVTACSTGDEAYTLAILLVEEAERAGKRLDIKVFATDMAERTLNQARGGVFPGGIEAEVTPERLARFFVKEDAVYRVRPDLRERVIFAPQNLLQDPPFSRLDIVSCRNLLIYLEPEVQHRVLGLLHFGLRDGGALFLGTSETVASVEGMFEPIDKRARIFRRVGPTRHGSVEFPLPHALRPARVAAAAAAAGAPPARLPAPRATFAAITQRALLEQHLPAAVLIDRDYRIQYYQGDTRPFLRPPRGAPTRELLQLAVDGVRGAIRVALGRLTADAGGAAQVVDGWIDTEPAGRRTRVAVTASHATPAGAPDQFVVSFGLRPDEAVPGEDGRRPAGGDLDNAFAAEELRRVRDELQSTIEELQTTNEEMKAAAEESSSITEELQSTNEELETSKEEMQSLNEELATVNAQLQSKAEEHQATANDLASLLSSTDIAVLFLDPRMRIRRFTPPVRDLIDLMQSDVGRPLSDLARKFDDPHLAADAEAVLARLVPMEREVAAHDGRWYLRRATPYRTADDRIDGVVVAFVDISARRRAELALQASEEQFRRSIEDAPIPMIMQAEDGQVLQVSRTWTELTGYTLADVPTADAWLSQAYGPGADEVRRHVYELFKGTIKTLDVEFALRTRGGRGGDRGGGDRHWSFSASAPGTLLDGRRYMVGMAVDVTERRRAEARQAFLLKLSDALRPLADPVAVEVEATRVLGEHLGADRTLYAEVEPDEDHIVVHRDHTTGGMASVVGRQQLSSFGAHWVEGYRAGRTLVTPDVRNVGGSQAAAFEAIGVRACVGVPVNKDGRFVGVLVVHSAKPREWTALEVGLVEETAERTWAAAERTRAEAAVGESQARLRQALFAARMGTWSWDIGRNRHARDENLNRLLGIEPFRTTLPLEAFYQHVHPDDVRAMRAAFADSARDGRPLSIEFRVVWPDGTVRWLRDQGEVFHNQDAPYMTGACVDVTDRRQAEAALRDSEERLRLVVEGARDFAMLLLDEAGRITAWNTGAERLLGLTEEEAVGQDGAIIFTPEDRAAGAPEHERAEAAATGSAIDERWHVRKGEGRFWGSGVMTALRNPDGSVRGFVKVLRDETARKEAEDAAREAHEAAELVNRTKDEFLATVSHELRTPLSAILIWANLLRGDAETGRPADKEAVNAILGSAESQRQLIDDLLDTSRITSGTLRLTMRPIDLAAVVRSGLDSIKPTADVKGVTLATQLGTNVGIVRADPDRLRQVLWNLLSNAIKFTAAGGRVDVGLHRRGEEVEIRVADTGSGIEPAFLPHVFDPFRQADASSTRVHGGLGLGLAICRKLVEQHGGTIEAESPGRGRGATFTVRLPLRAVRPVAAPATAAAAKPRRGKGAKATKAAAAAAALTSLAGVRILLVEDDAATRAGIEALLRVAGATVTAVNGSDAAIAAYERDRPDVLVSDIGMPGKDGYALLGDLHARDAQRGRRPVPAIALTALAQDADRERARAAGFDRHVSKPVDQDLLLSTCRDLADERA